MNEPVMRIGIIKKILNDEINMFYRESIQILKSNGMLSDVPIRMLHYAYSNLLKELTNCNTYEALEDFVISAGYGMSLQEWIDSLYKGE